MKRTTITLPQDLVNELLAITRAKNKTQAVLAAIQEKIRRKKLEMLKGIAVRARERKKAVTGS